jgi:hypothetical protein
MESHKIPWFQSPPIRSSSFLEALVTVVPQRTVLFKEKLMVEISHEIWVNYNISIFRLT